jgi:serine beta-lactamase-like protein LACTB, mitochondrial
MLVADGRLNLESKVGDYLSSAPSPLREIRVSYLLNHTAGLRDYRPFEWYKIARNHCVTAADALPAFASDAVEGTPGALFSYSSFNYVALSAVLEQAGGASLATQFRQRIVGPAGLTDTGFAPGENLATPYEENAIGRIVVVKALDLSCLAGAGGIWSSAEDLARFGGALLSGRVMHAEQVAAMFAPSQTSGGQALNYGMGWGTNEVDGQPYVGHSGGSPGGRSAIVVFPRGGVAVGIVANLEGPRVVDEAAKIGVMFIRR